MNRDVLIAELETACVLARRIQEENAHRIRRILERVTGMLADEHEDGGGSSLDRARPRRRRR
jgi:hypothetical protein